MPAMILNTPEHDLENIDHEMEDVLVTSAFDGYTEENKGEYE